MTTSKTIAELGVGDELPPHRVIARNPSTASENKIHDDETARRYGFRGGLVPGVIDYAYMATPVAAVLGEAWLTSGEASVALVHPLYEGEQAIARARVTAVEDTVCGRRLVFDVWVENPAGERCGVGSAALSERPAAVAAPDIIARDPGPLPEPPPELELATAPVGRQLGRHTVQTSPAEARAYADLVDDPNPLFRDGSSYGEPLMHPGWLLSECNSAFTRNYRFGPWIHTRSEIRYLGPAVSGRAFTYHGRLSEAYERRGHHYATLDLFCTDDRGAPVMQARHNAIFRVQPRS